MEKIKFIELNLNTKTSEPIFINVKFIVSIRPQGKGSLVKVANGELFHYNDSRTPQEIIKAINL